SDQDLADDFLGVVAASVKRTAEHGERCEAKAVLGHCGILGTRIRGVKGYPPACRPDGPPALPHRWACLSRSPRRLRPDAPRPALGPPRRIAVPAARKASQAARPRPLLQALLAVAHGVAACGRSSGTGVNCRSWKSKLKSIAGETGAIVMRSIVASGLSAKTT